MKLSIIADDNHVYVDKKTFEVDLSACGMPSNVWALQFDDSTGNGHIEFLGETGNQNITSLPDWAVAAKSKWDEAKLAADAALQESIQILKDARTKAAT